MVTGLSQPAMNQCLINPGVQYYYISALFLSMTLQTKMQTTTTLSTVTLVAMLLQNEQTATCYFNYPRPMQADSTLAFERLNDGTIRATLTTKQNDPHINSHNQLLLQHWRAN